MLGAKSRSIQTLRERVPFPALLTEQIWSAIGRSEHSTLFTSPTCSASHNKDRLRLTSLVGKRQTSISAIALSKGFPITGRLVITIST